MGTQIRASRSAPGEEEEAAEEDGGEDERADEVAGTGGRLRGKHSDVHLSGCEEKGYCMAIEQGKAQKFSAKICMVIMADIFMHWRGIGISNLVLSEGLEQFGVLWKGVKLETVSIHIHGKQLRAVRRKGNLQFAQHQADVLKINRRSRQPYLLNLVLLNSIDEFGVPPVLNTPR